MIYRKIFSIFKTEKFKHLLKFYKIKSIAVFGSYAKGEPSVGSDVDFLVEFEKGADLLDQVGLKNDLEKLIKKPVDVATPRGLSRYIREKVLREAVYIHV